MCAAAKSVHSVNLKLLQAFLLVSQHSSFRIEGVLRQRSVSIDRLAVDTHG